MDLHKFVESLCVIEQEMLYDILGDRIAERNKEKLKIRVHNTKVVEQWAGSNLPKSAQNALVVYYAEDKFLLTEEILNSIPYSDLKRVRNLGQKSVENIIKIQNDQTR
jgi:hypothetical protein